MLWHERNKCIYGRIRTTNNNNTVIKPNRTEPNWTKILKETWANWRKQRKKTHFSCDWATCHCIRIYTRAKINNMQYRFIFIHSNNIQVHFELCCWLLMMMWLWFSLNHSFLHFFFVFFFGFSFTSSPIHVFVHLFLCSLSFVLFVCVCMWCFFRFLFAIEKCPFGFAEIVLFFKSSKTNEITKYNQL